MNPTQYGEKEIVEALSVLEQLRHCGGRARTSRLKILKCAVENAPLKLFFKLCFDPRYGFCIPLLTNDPGQADSPSFCANFASFLHLVERLLTSELSGAAALIEARKFLDSCSSLEAQAYAGILARDPHVGISQRLLQRVWPELVPDLEVPKASMKSSFRVLFVLVRSPISGKLLVNALTERLRPLPLLNEPLGFQFLSAGREVIVDCEVYLDGITSPELEYLLSIKVKTQTKGGFKRLYYGLRCRVHAVRESNVGVSCERGAVCEVVSAVRAKHPRSSIRAAQEIAYV